MSETATVPATVFEVDIDQVHPNPDNPRTIKDANFKKLVKSIREFPDMLWKRPPVVVTSPNGYMALGGNKRTDAARAAGYKRIPVMLADEWDTDQRKRFVVLDNDQAGEWDFKMLTEQYSLTELLADTSIEIPRAFLKTRSEREDDVPLVSSDPVTQEGFVWVLGDHRVMCGDCSRVDHVATLMGGERAQLIHADPPYGMGKEADGVINDNLYREELDRFQMRWWSAIRPHVDSNGSAYIWGNAPDLWRLWYLGGLSASERLELRNEIVWDKKNIAGMASPDLTQYPEASERCLFFQFGDQFLGNINKDDFPDAWEGVRAYMEGEAKRAGIVPKDIRRLCHCQMYGHWFTRSQFTMMPEHHYKTLAAEYPGCFSRPWAEVKADWDKVRSAGRVVINGKLDGVRSYFDNSHDVMRDVWDFPRVTGIDRHDHATPKPVAMMERILRSSTPEGGIVVDPFGGSGPTLIAAEKSHRRCYTMEIFPAYVDVIVQRWQEFTGKVAIREATGQTYAEVREDHMGG